MWHHCKFYLVWRLTQSHIERNNVAYNTTKKGVEHTRNSTLRYKPLDYLTLKWGKLFLKKKTRTCDRATVFTIRLQHMRICASILQWHHNEHDGVSNHQPHECSTVYSGADERKHESSASLAFVRGIHRWSVNSPHKGPVTRKKFPFDEVIMIRYSVELEGSYGYAIMLPNRKHYTTPSPCLSINCTVEVWEWISDFSSRFTGHVLTYLCWV